jgi:uncharacterized membrane protein
MNIKKMTIISVFIALTTVMTMQGFALPTGWFNLGDIVIFTAAALFGPVPGMLIGGIGASLGDLILGYGIWAPGTLIIKGFYGFMIGKSVQNGLKPVIAFVFATIVLVVGYLVYQGLFLGGFGPAMKDVIGNIGQGAISTVAATILYSLLKNRVKID